MPKLRIHYIATVIIETLIELSQPFIQCTGAKLMHHYKYTKFSNQVKSPVEQLSYNFLIGCSGVCSTTFSRIDAFVAHQLY